MTSGDRHNRSNNGKPVSVITRKRTPWKSSLREGRATEIPKDCHKKAKLVTIIEQVPGQSAEYWQNVKRKWRRLSEKIILQLGAKEMAALCHEFALEFNVVTSSDDLSSGVQSDRTNATAPWPWPTTAELSPLRAQLRKLQARNAEQEKMITELKESAYIDRKAAKAKELELLSIADNSMALRKTLEKRIADLEREKDKQSKMIDFYGSRMEELKTRTRELEDSLATTSLKSPRPHSSSYGTQQQTAAATDENSVEELLMQNKKLRNELTQVRCELDVALVQVRMEMGQKDAAIEELIALQNQTAIYSATKTDLEELEKQKQMFEEEKAELAKLPGLRRKFEAAEKELEALYDRIPYQERLLANAAEQLRSTLRREEETRHIDSDDELELFALRNLKVRYEAAIQELHTLQKQRVCVVGAKEELASLRKRRARLVTLAEELDEIIKQVELSDAEREELELLRREKTTVEIAATEVLPTFEFGGRQYRVLGVKEEDDDEHGRYSLDLEAAKTRIRQISIHHRRSHSI